MTDKNEQIIQIHDTGDGRFLTTVDFRFSYSQKEQELKKIRVFQNQYGKFFASSLEDINIINDKVTMKKEICT